MITIVGVKMVQTVQIDV